jgi:hypothetical protein
MTIFVLFVSAYAVLAADEQELRKIDQAKRIFDLRRAVNQTPDEQRDASYYRALIEARFGREEVAIQHLRAFLAANPPNGMVNEAHHELADALIRRGRYGEAAAEFDQLLRLMSPSDPERGELTNSRAIFAALKDVNPQTIEFTSEKTLTAKSGKLGLWSLPIEANGKQAEWVLDTNMTFSTVTASEAKRVGLTLLDTGGNGSSDHTGKKLPIRLAVGKDVRIGSAHLQNVVFAVVPDNALDFGPDGLARGIVGLPAIRALGSIAVSAKGAVLIHSESKRLQGDPNLFFDGLTPIVEVHHRGHAMPMTLDSGGTTTYLYSTFRDALTLDERAKLSRENRGFGGVNGSTKVRIEVVPQLDLELSGRTVALRRVAMRLDSNHGSPESDGLLGIDALKGGFAIDFDTMRLQLD